MGKTKKLDLKKIISLWNKFGNPSIISNTLAIPEDYVSDYVKTGKLPKEIKIIMYHPYSLLRYKELIRLIERSALLSGISDASDKKNIQLFNELFTTLLSDTFIPLIHRSVQRRMVSQNNGKLCPKCDSKKQAKKINDIEIITDEILKLAESQTKKNNTELEPEYDSEWKCVDCGHEWRGAKVTFFLDSDEI